MQIKPQFSPSTKVQPAPAPKLPSPASATKVSQDAFLPSASREHSVPNWGPERNYLMHVPKNYDPAVPTPVVVVVHGYTHDAAKMEAITSPNGNPAHPDSLNSLADKENFVVVYPNGTPLGRFRQGRGWNGGGGKNGLVAVSSPAVENNINDIKFLEDMLNDVESKINVDKNRVFGSGISNGGALAFKMAAQMTDRFAAIAVVAAADQFAFSNNSSEPKEDMPLLVMHGQEDPVWPYKGGGALLGKFASVPESIELWAGWNQARRVSQEQLPDVDPNDGTRVEKTVYRGDSPRSHVELYKVVGGGHAWPGGHQFSPEFSIGKVTRDINANEVMWDFFSQHSKN